MEKGQVIATMYASKKALFKAAEQKYKEAITIEAVQIEEKPLIYARITKHVVEVFTTS
ncbi:MAG: hypothetical protein RR275_03845 [Lachnospiraceae bacterium]